MTDNVNIWINKEAPTKKKRTNEKRSRKRLKTVIKCALPTAADAFFVCKGRSDQNKTHQK